MFKLALLCMLTTFATLSWGSSLPNEAEGLYLLKGEHSKRGSYKGELEIHQGSSGQLEAIKVITYDHFQYENLRVQEVWTGKARLNNQGLVVNYALKKADYIVRLNNKRRSPEDFKTPFLIETQYDQHQETQFKDNNDSFYSEEIVAKNELPSHPLWENLRTKLYAGGADIPTWLKPILKFSEKRTGFYTDPYVLSFKDRDEFKNVRPYIIFDPTDFDFYQKNQDILRIANKVTDEISMTESMSRRNSYAFTLDEKADYLESNMQERHLPKNTNILTYAVVDDNQQFVTYGAEFSGGLWSGLYAGSQAMRYLATHDPEALENFKRVLKGTYLLMDITGDPKEFARSVAPFNEEQSKDGWIRGSGIYSDLMYKPQGNNDMIKGLTHALMWATYIIPESDTETWNEMKQKSKQLLALNIFSKKIQNQPSAVGLYAIINKDEKMTQKFRKLYKNYKIMLGGYSVNATFYVRGSADWSGINLGVVGTITEMMIAEKLGANHISNQLRERLMDSWVTYESSKRALVTVAAYAFAYKRGVLGPDFKKLKDNQARFSEGLQNAEWVLRSIPIKRSTQDIEIDHSMKPDWCLSPVPQIFWKAFKSPPPPPSYFFQGLYDYPLFEFSAFTTNYFWKDSAFDFKGSGAKNIENSGADFLYLYWMSKYAGLNYQ